MKSKLKLRSIVIGVLLAFVILASVFQISSNNTYYNMEKVKYYNLDNNQISARYYKGTKPQGVFIINDINKNAKDSWLMADQFAKVGYSVYIIDLPSQGKTKGYLDFCYKSNEYIAEQYYTGVVAFSQLAGLNESDIHIVSNGIGARVALQTATKGFFNPEDITLISTKTNILNKIQLDVINYNDDRKSKFIKNINSANPGEDIHLIYTNLNNESSVKENKEIEKRLNSDAILDENAVNTRTNNVKAEQINFVIPGFEMTNSKVIKSTVSYIANKDGYSYTMNSLLKFKSLLTGLILLAMLTMMVLVYKTFNNHYYTNRGSRTFDKNFVISKILSLIPASIMVFLIPVSIYFLIGAFMPIPYFSLVRMSLVCCPGIICYYLYYRTTFANDLGSILFYKEERKNIKGGMIVLLVVLAMIFIASVSGLNIVYNIFSLKSVWLVFFTFLCSFTFYIEEREKEVIVTSRFKRGLMSLLNFGFVFIPTIFLFIFGQFSIGIEMLILSIIIIFCLAIGNILRVVNSPTKLNAVIQALILNLLVLASTVLFL